MADLLKSREAVTIVWMIASVFLCGIFGWSFFRERYKRWLDPSFVLFVYFASESVVRLLVLLFYSAPHHHRPLYQSLLLLGSGMGAMTGCLLCILVFAPRYGRMITLACGMIAAAATLILYSVGML